MTTVLREHAGFKFIQDNIMGGTYIIRESDDKSTLRNTGSDASAERQSLLKMTDEQFVYYCNKQTYFSDEK